MTLIASRHLQFEQLNADHADELYAVLTTPSVLAFIDPDGSRQTLEELKTEYAVRARGPLNPVFPDERWFNVAIRLSSSTSEAVGRLEATSYGTWGEVAFLLGKPWWGKGLASEALCWWHDYLADVVPGVQWWATVHPNNHRSIKLLTRFGYERVDSSKRPELQSFDEGDLCFFLPNYAKKHHL